MADPPGIAAHKPHFHRDHSWKAPVRVATVSAGTLATSFENGDTVDTVVLATGDRILIKDQAAGAENGIYVVAASGAPTRAYDMNVDTEVLGALVYVVAGTQAGTFWRPTNTATPSMGSTAIPWARFGTGAPSTVDYLVGTASGDLSAEIVVGATPGGELGGTWASPTVDATHSGSAHLALGSTSSTAAAGDHTHTGTIAMIAFIIDGGGSAITTGIKGDLEIPFACTITAWRLFADASGAIVVDVWKDSYANFPPTDADAMPGAGKEPTIAASGVKAEDTSITDWATDDIAAGDILRFNVDSAATITRCTLALTVTRT